MPDIDTPYGSVDAAALQSLQQRYDTLVIQQAVDLLDKIRARCGIDGRRDDLLRLHGMAHTVINGASLVYSTDDLTLVEQADDLIEELEDWQLVLERMLLALRPLQDLRSQSDDLI
ncbi:Tn3 family transposase post-transcriptional regulator TnpC [Cupriavidus sp. UYPR2.512]|uniref:Tn3 family transposase post-transcriptional regulator TnpC n=1 Tax=Cupriavidus sp. UYPR2.512 TaxID=1080187 RepID=UPI0003624F0E|nr:Tn3 family transposase post-transcriptional regulator TnpC [Cupriavidus sp. UYPR2.512]UIF87619.1 transposase [Cupriavidus necator]